MRSPVTLRIVILALGVFASPTRADLIYMPDGFTLLGKIKRESTNFVDPQSGQQFTVAKLNGFFMVDDGARRMVFSQQQVQEVDDRDIRSESDLVTLRRHFSRPGRVLPFPILRIADFTPWDGKWERTLTIDTVYKGERARVDLRQRLSELTPFYARVDGLKYTCFTYYLTRELGPEAVEKLLASHPDLALKGQTGDDVRRWKRFRFLVQAGWYDQADRALDQIRKDTPDQKDKIDQARAHLLKLRTQQLYDEIELAQTAGRHRWAQQQLANFPIAVADEKLLTHVRNLRVKYEAANVHLDLASHYLKDLPPKIADDLERKVFSEASAGILAELNHDNVGRLDTFVRFAQQAERLGKLGRKPTETPEQVLALAVSGWLLGNSSAQLDVSFARRLWQTRQFVLDYQRTRIAGTRQLRLEEYQKGQALAFDEIAQLIHYLPPPEPEEKISPLPVALQTDVAGQGQPVAYQVQLPPEYTNGRPYPVLFVLHQTGEKALDMLQRWSALAARHGYILVAPEWEGGLGSGYNFTAEDQGSVLTVLRDLCRRFQVDNNRVFLYGYGEGGVMAYDVSLSHPDLFAGVVVMCSRPRYFARKYWPNAQYLPFYVVDGDRDGESPADTRLQFERWLPHGYPALYVEYKGRGAEWFGAELPFIFDWMDRKKRSPGFPDLGRASNGGPFGEEFQSMRQIDSHFYWLSSNAINPRNLNDAGHWNQLTLPAAFQARIGEGNYIVVNVRGLNDLTVWLGSGMVDFNKPVTIRVQPTNALVNRLIKPDLSTLLEDFYYRGDRQRLFWARVDFSLR